MRFPSLDSLLSAARATLVRFPLVLLAGALLALSVIADTDSERNALIPGLGIAFLFAITLFTERRGWSAVARLGAQTGGIALLLYYFSLPGDFSTTDQIRFALFAIGAHLLVAFAPYTGRDEVEGFWRYNEILFIRALTAALFTTVLFAGLALALASIDRLFNVDVEPQAYADLAGVLYGVFATWFFLSGVPTDFEALRENGTYPRGLKIFTQYVLLPLVSIYLVILYLYAAKIIISWELPNGWVSSLIIGFAVAGILASLLLWPIRDQEGNRWIRRFFGGFHWAMLPLVLLLVLAIWRRVADYGITENRYFIIALAVWLAGITLYFIISRRDNIKLIPITLCVMALVGSFGPWSAFEVSVDSQTTRLEELLRDNKILVGDTVVAATLSDSVAKDVSARVYSILYFLDDRGGLDRLRPWFPGHGAGDLTMAEIQEAIGLGSALGYAQTAESFSFGEWEPMERYPIPVRGFDFCYTIAGIESGERDTLTLDEAPYILSYSDSLASFILEGRERMSFDLRGIIASADSVRAASVASGGSADAPFNPGAPAIIEAIGSGMRGRLVIHYLRGHSAAGRAVLSSMSGYLLLGRDSTAAPR